VLSSDNVDVDDDCSPASALCTVITLHADEVSLRVKDREQQDRQSYTVPKLSSASNSTPEQVFVKDSCPSQAVSMHSAASVPVAAAGRVDIGTS